MAKAEKSAALNKVLKEKLARKQKLILVLKELVVVKHESCVNDIVHPQFLALQAQHQEVVTALRKEIVSSCNTVKKLVQLQDVNRQQIDEWKSTCEELRGCLNHSEFQNKQTNILLGEAQEKAKTLKKDLDQANKKVETYEEKQSFSCKCKIIKSKKRKSKDKFTEDLPPTPPSSCPEISKPFSQPHIFPNLLTPPSTISTQATDDSNPDVGWLDLNSRSNSPNDSLPEDSNISLDDAPIALTKDGCDDPPSFALLEQEEPSEILATAEHHTGQSLPILLDDESCLQQSVFYENLCNGMKPGDDNLKSKGDNSDNSLENHQLNCDSPSRSKKLKSAEQHTGQSLPFLLDDESCLQQPVFHENVRNGMKTEDDNPKSKGDNSDNSVENQKLNCDSPRRSKKLKTTEQHTGQSLPFLLDDESCLQQPVFDEIVRNGMKTGDDNLKSKGDNSDNSVENQKLNCDSPRRSKKLKTTEQHTGQSLPFLLDDESCLQQPVFHENVRNGMKTGDDNIESKDDNSDNSVQNPESLAVDDESLTTERPQSTQPVSIFDLPLVDSEYKNFCSSTSNKVDVFTRPVYEIQPTNYNSESFRCDFDVSDSSDTESEVNLSSNPSSAANKDNGNDLHQEIAPIDSKLGSGPSKSVVASKNNSVGSIHFGSPIKESLESNDSFHKPLENDKNAMELGADIPPLHSQLNETCTSTKSKKPTLSDECDLGSPGSGPSNSVVASKNNSVESILLVSPIKESSEGSDSLCRPLEHDRHAMELRADIPPQHSLLDETPAKNENPTLSDEWGLGSPSSVSSNSVVASKINSIESILLDSSTKESLEGSNSLHKPSVSDQHAMELGADIPPLHSQLDETLPATSKNPTYSEECGPRSPSSGSSNSVVASRYNSVESIHFESPIKESLESNDSFHEPLENDQHAVELGVDIPPPQSPLDLSNDSFTSNHLTSETCDENVSVSTLNTTSSTPRERSPSTSNPSKLDGKPLVSSDIEKSLSGNSSEQDRSSNIESAPLVPTRRGRKERNTKSNKVNPRTPTSKSRKKSTPEECNSFEPRRSLRISSSANCQAKGKPVVDDRLSASSGKSLSSAEPSSSLPSPKKRRGRSKRKLNDEKIACPISSGLPNNPHCTDPLVENEKRGDCDSDEVPDADTPVGMDESRYESSTSSVKSPADTTVNRPVKSSENNIENCPPRQFLSKSTASAFLRPSQLSFQGGSQFGESSINKKTVDSVVSCRSDPVLRAGNSLLCSANATIPPISSSSKTYENGSTVFGCKNHLSFSDFQPQGNRTSSNLNWTTSAINTKDNSYSRYRAGSDGDQRKNRDASQDDMDSLTVGPLCLSFNMLSLNQSPNTKHEDSFNFFSRFKKDKAFNYGEYSTFPPTCPQPFSFTDSLVGSSKFSDMTKYRKVDGNSRSSLDSNSEVTIKIKQEDSPISLKLSVPAGNALDFDSLYSIVRGAQKNKGTLSSAPPSDCRNQIRSPEDDLFKKPLPPVNRVVRDSSSRSYSNERFIRANRQLKIENKTSSSCKWGDNSNERPNSSQAFSSNLIRNKNFSASKRIEFQSGSPKLLQLRASRLANGVSRCFDDDRSPIKGIVPLAPLNDSAVAKESSSTECAHPVVLDSAEGSDSTDDEKPVELPADFVTGRSSVSPLRSPRSEDNMESIELDENYVQSENRLAVSDETQRKPRDHAAEMFNESKEVGCQSPTLSNEKMAPGSSPPISESIQPSDDSDHSISTKKRRIAHSPRKGVIDKAHSSLTEEQKLAALNRLSRKRSATSPPGEVVRTNKLLSSDLPRSSLDSEDQKVKLSGSPPRKIAKQKISQEVTKKEQSVHGPSTIECSQCHLRTSICICGVERIMDEMRKSCPALLSPLKPSALEEVESEATKLVKVDRYTAIMDLGEDRPSSPQDDNSNPNANEGNVDDLDKIDQSAAGRQINDFDEHPCQILTEAAKENLDVVSVFDKKEVSVKRSTSSVDEDGCSQQDSTVGKKKRRKARGPNKPRGKDTRDDRSEVVNRSTVDAEISDVSSKICKKPNENSRVDEVFGALSEQSAGQPPEKYKSNAVGNVTRKSTPSSQPVEGGLEKLPLTSGKESVSAQLLPGRKPLQIAEEGVSGNFKEEGMFSATKDGNQSTRGRSFSAEEIDAKCYDNKQVGNQVNTSEGGMQLSDTLATSTGIKELGKKSVNVVIDESIDKLLDSIGTVSSTVPKRQESQNLAESSSSWNSLAHLGKFFGMKRSSNQCENSQVSSDDSDSEMVLDYSSSNENEVKKERFGEHYGGHNRNANSVTSDSRNSLDDEREVVSKMKPCFYSASQPRIDCNDYKARNSSVKTEPVIRTVHSNDSTSNLESSLEAPPVKLPGFYKALVENPPESKDDSDTNNKPNCSGTEESNSSSATQTPKFYSAVADEPVQDTTGSKPLIKLSYRPEIIKSISEEDVVPCCINLLAFASFYELNDPKESTAIPEPYKPHKIKIENCWNEFLSNNNLQEDLAKAVSTMSKSKAHHVAKGLIAAVSDSNCAVKDYGTVGFASHYTKLQKKALLLVTALAKGRHTYFNAVLSEIEEFLLPSPQSPPSAKHYAVTNLSIIYALICRTQGYSNRAQSFIYDALYGRHISNFRIIYQILMAIPQIIPFANDAIGPLTYTIVYLIMNHGIYQKLTPFFLSRAGVSALRSTLSERYRYKFPPDLTRDCVMDELMSNIMAQGCDKAIILLSKSQGYRWTYTVVQKHIFPVLDSWIKGQSKQDENYIAAIIKLLGMISRCFAISVCESFVSHSLAHLKLIIERKPSLQVSDAVVEALAHFLRLNPQAVVSVLAKWIPHEYKVSKSSIRTLKNVTRSKSLSYWKQFITP